jgi:hypothetical protein
MPRPTGRRIAVAGGPNGARALQAAFDQAKAGDVIALESGATFVGNFTIPKKAATPPGWIVVRPSSPDSELPPPGTRMTPERATRLPKIVSPNADPVLNAGAGAHHFRFVGVEVTITPESKTIYDLIRLGASEQNSPEQVPHDLVFDRCYIHGSPQSDVRRGIALNSASTAVIDSYISDIHEQGADSQAICGWNGPGPFKIVGNYLEGAGENVMFGGADPNIPNLVPSDIEFRRNHCFKPLSWKKDHSTYRGKQWSVKNLFELKNARRVLVNGNVFENNWAHAQDGFAILFTVRNQEGTAPWSVVEDINFSNNVVSHTAAGISILGRDYNSPSEQTKRIKISNNLFYDVGGKQWGHNGRFLQLTETIDVTVDHNTVFHTGTVITAHGKPNAGFVFTNNLMAHNEYGVIGDDVGTGNPTLSRYFPGAVFKKNVIAGGRGSYYPAENFFPPTLEEAGLLDRPGSNFALSSTSAYRSAGTDGKSVGYDFAALEAATGDLKAVSLRFK